MRNQKKGVPTRTVVAIALIFASFISSFALSRAANQTELLWSARSVLIPGSKIIANDLALRRVALPDGDARGMDGIQRARMGEDAAARTDAQTPEASSCQGGERGIATDRGPSAAGLFRHAR